MTPAKKQKTDIGFHQRQGPGPNHKQDAGQNTIAGIIPHPEGIDYTIRALARACDVLKCFNRSQGALSLHSIAGTTGIVKSTAFRILYTLVQSGMLERVDQNTYCLPNTVRPKRTYRFGYATQSEEFSFSRLVSESIASSAYAAGVELFVLNNRYSPKTAVRNAEIFVREHVDLVIEFQTDQQCASAVASLLHEAGIPLVAIDIPHPGAHYFGANNYRAGLIGGRALAQACITQWNGKADELLLIELPMAGPLVRSRLTGILAGLREVMPKFPEANVRFLNGNGRFESSLEAVRKHLRRSQGAKKHVLVAGINDPSSLGALEAFNEAGLEDRYLAMGQNASMEARQEMRRPHTRLVGSVGFFPESYGEAVMALALDTVHGKQTPLATFVKHHVIHRGNLDEFYPNDGLMPTNVADSLLFTSR